MRESASSLEASEQSGLVNRSSSTPKDAGLSSKDGKEGVVEVVMVIT